MHQWDIISKLEKCYNNDGLFVLGEIYEFGSIIDATQFTTEKEIVTTISYYCNENPDIPGGIFILYIVKKGYYDKYKIYFDNHNCNIEIISDDVSEDIIAKNLLHALTSSWLIMTDRELCEFKSIKGCESEHCQKLITTLYEKCFHPLTNFFYAFDE